MAGRKNIKLPHSKMDLAVAQLLEKNGFVKSVTKKGRAPKRVLDLELNPENPINGVKFTSKPSIRMYKGYRDLYSVKKGYGIGVVTTSKGIMTQSQAREQKVGGQLLFEIW